MYVRPTTYVRNDALTPGGYGRLSLNAREIEAAFRAEHIESSGEHNTPLIARTMGTMYWDGSKYNLVVFNSDVSLASTGAWNGRVTVTLAAGRYEKDAGPLMLQNASATGSSKPCLSWGQWFDDTRVIIYSTFWGGSLGTPGSGSWGQAGEDCSFHLGVHSKALPNSSLASFGTPLLPFQGLRTGSDVYVNTLVKSSADLELALRAGHSNGAHNVREIPKLWAHVQWSGHYGIVDQVASPSFLGGGITSVDEVSTGVAEVLFDAPLASTNYQVFVDVDYARLTGSPSDYFIACVPFAGHGVRSFRIYFYKRFLNGSGVEYFDRESDIDFHLWVGHA